MWTRLQSPQLSMWCDRMRASKLSETFEWKKKKWQGRTSKLRERSSAVMELLQDCVCVCCTQDFAACVCMCACLRARACVCVPACLCACVCSCVHFHRILTHLISEHSLLLLRPPPGGRPHVLPPRVVDDGKRWEAADGATPPHAGQYAGQAEKIQRGGQQVQGGRLTPENSPVQSESTKDSWGMWQFSVWLFIFFFYLRTVSVECAFFPHDAQLPVLLSFSAILITGSRMKGLRRATRSIACVFARACMSTCVRDVLIWPCTLIRADSWFTYRPSAILQCLWVVS